MLFGTKEVAETSVQNGLKKKLLPLFLMVAVSLLSTGVSVVTWFHTTFEFEIQTNDAGYALRMDWVKNASDTYGGDNLLWATPIEGILYMDEEVTLTRSVPADSYLVISNMRNSMYATQYEVVISQGDTVLLEHTADACGDKQVLEPGTATEPILVKGSADLSLPIRIQVRTADPEGRILAVSTPQELQSLPTTSKDTVYLTQDIVLEEPLTLNRYPNINLGGHRLQVDELAVYAGKNTVESMTLYNGTLVVGGEVYTNTHTVKNQGEGRVTVTLADLKTK